MEKQFEVRVYGAGYMGADKHLKATAEQIEMGYPWGDDNEH